MSLVGKIFAVLSMLIAVFYAGSTAALVSLQENYRKKLLNTEADHKQHKEDWTRTEAGLEKQIADADRENKRIDQERREAVGENVALQASELLLRDGLTVLQRLTDDQEATIADMNKRLDDLRKDFLAKSTDHDGLAKKVGEQRAQIEDRNKRIDRLVQDRDNAQNNLMSAERELTKVAADLDRYKGYMGKLKEIDPVRHGQLLKADTTDLVRIKTIRGRVTAVDDSQGLVIVDVGQRNDVRQNMTFIVFRGDQYMGKVRVQEVFPDAAAATYIRPMQGPVEVADEVTTRLAFEDF